MFARNVLDAIEPHLEAEKRVVVSQLPHAHRLQPIQEQLFYRNVKRFRGGLVFKAYRLLYHSTLGLRVIKKNHQVPPPRSCNRRAFMHHVESKCTTSMRGGVQQAREPHGAAATLWWQIAVGSATLGR